MKNKVIEIIKEMYNKIFSRKFLPYTLPHTFDSNNRESRNYKQIKSAYEELRNLLEDEKVKVYISGGLAPYLLLNQDSGRFHDDIDTIVAMKDMTSLRRIVKKAGLYNPNWDSKTFVKDGTDYGLEVMINGVPIGIYPFIHKNKKIVQYTYDPYTTQCKIKELEIEDLSDYIMTYRGIDGRLYDTMSMEYIKFSKEQAGRPKDIIDLKNIENTGIREYVYNRLQMFKQIQDTKAESLNFAKSLDVELNESSSGNNYYEKEKRTCDKEERDL